jgi:uncharacterized protein YlxP (DUF503 family)
MVVGVLEIRGVVRQSHSLKEKRRVVKSVKERLASRFNISIAEVDYLDSWQQVGLGVSLVGTDRQFVDRCLAEVIKFIRLSSEFELIDYTVDFV